MIPSNAHPSGTALVNLTATALSLVVALGLAAHVPPVSPELPPAWQRRHAHADAEKRSRDTATIHGVQPSFEPNRGQADPAVSFLGRGPGYTLALTATEAILAAARGERHSLFRMRFVGSRPTQPVSGLGTPSGTANYIIGDDPGAWRTNIPTYDGVAYRGLYPGIDLVFHAPEGPVEYDFILAPGADHRSITLAFPEAEGTEIDALGNLAVRGADGEIRHLRPEIYQEAGGRRRMVPGGFVFRGRERIGFQVGPHDPSRSLIIDPVILYSTLLGGEGMDAGLSVAADEEGHAYVTGFTSSVGFPVTPGATQTTKRSGIDAFVTKLDPTGSSILFSTYIGGGGDDWGSGIALDDSGNAYLTGRTDSTDFPTTPEAFDTSFGGGVDAFALKLNDTGSALGYSSYLGGTGFEHDRDDILITRAAAVAVDGSGSAYLTGRTTSPDFPTRNALQPIHGGGSCPGANLVCSDAYLTKLDPAGTNLVYSTFLGGDDDDAGKAIFVDGSANAYIAGSAFSGFPVTPGAFRTTTQGFDAFVTKMNAAGSALVFSTFLGGELSDDAAGVAADDSGNAYVTGSTTSFEFPITAGAFQTAKIGAGPDAFVTKLSPTGSALVYSTYVGERETDEAVGIAVDGNGNAYVAGHSELGVPVLPCPFANFDVFAASLNPVGSALNWATCLGGTRDEFAGGIALDGHGNISVTGRTASSGAFSTSAFPTTAGAFQTTFAGGATDAFVFKVGTAADLAMEKADPPGRQPTGRNMTYTLTVAHNGPDAAQDVTVVDRLPSTVTFVSATTTQGTCGHSVGAVTCVLGPMGAGTATTIEVVVVPQSPGVILNTASVTSSSADPNPEDNADSESTSICRITSRRTSIPCP
jgi:uncharacterized repeat protein (TIGR01451 family)